jgi:hypothetical protein
MDAGGGRDMACSRTGHGAAFALDLQLDRKVTAADEDVEREKQVQMDAAMAANALPNGAGHSAIFVQILPKSLVGELMEAVDTGYAEKPVTAERVSVVNGRLADRLPRKR